MIAPSPGVRSDSIRWSSNASREAEMLLDPTDINYLLPVARITNVYIYKKGLDIREALR